MAKATQNHSYDGYLFQSHDIVHTESARIGATITMKYYPEALSRLCDAVSENDRACKQMAVSKFITITQPIDCL